MENLAPETIVVSLATADEAIVCRRDQLRLRRFSLPQAAVPFGQPVRLRLEMPFCRRRFDLHGTVISSTTSGTDLDLDPIPGELELLIDHLERSQLNGGGLQFRDLEEEDESSTSIEIQIEESDGGLEFTDAEDSGYWASLITQSDADVGGALDAPGLLSLAELCQEGGPTGVLRIQRSDGVAVGYVQRGVPLLFLAEPPPDEGNLDLALIGSPDIDLNVFGDAIERQEVSGDPLAVILLEMRAIPRDALLELARQEARMLLKTVGPDPGGRFSFWAAEVPMASDGVTVDVGAMLLAAGLLLDGG